MSARALAVFMADVGTVVAAIYGACEWGFWGALGCVVAWLVAFGLGYRTGMEE